jgi:hypothetical protein
MCQPLPKSDTYACVAKWSLARGQACLALKQYDEAMKMAVLAKSKDLIAQVQKALLAQQSPSPSGSAKP